jgi:G3E family GTPase
LLILCSSRNKPIPDPPIQVAIVTGFLGAGKTTLIARLLRDPGMSGTAVIVNEFGEVGLDHELLASSTESVVALPNGCLCCMVRTDLVQALLELDAQRSMPGRNFGRVLVETSGLADPAPILHALMTDPALAGRFAIAAVTTVVDTGVGAATLARHPEARRQVAFADRLLLAKRDLYAPDAALLGALAALNATAPVGDAREGAAALFAAHSHEVRASAAVHGGDVRAITVLRDRPVPGVALTLFLEALAEHCGARLLRLKGLVDLAETPGRPAVVHGVQHIFAPVDWLEAWPSADRRSRIVLIGEGIPAYFPARLLEAILADVPDLPVLNCPSSQV